MQTTKVTKATKATKTAKTIGLCVLCALRSRRAPRYWRDEAAPFVASDPGNGDWPMWAARQTAIRFQHEGTAGRLGHQEQAERQMGRRFRLAELRQSGRRRRRRVGRHQQREYADPNSRATGPMAFRKTTGSSSGSRRTRSSRPGAPTTGRIGRRLLAAGRRHARVLHQQSWRRGAQTSTFRDGKNDGPITDEKPPASTTPT